MSSTTVVFAEKEKIKFAYEEIRDRNSEIRWMVLYCHEGTISLESTGYNYDKLYEKFKEDVCLFAYVKLEYEHDGKSKWKCVLISWAGKYVKTEHKDRVHKEKETVKEVIKEYTCELFFYEERKLTEIKTREAIKKSGHQDRWEK